MADIRALEMEFAKNPSLDNCIHLCDAYLGAKRFMEAMVVCKKGIRSAPNEPRGKVMLARVYFEQGKLPKAQQELQAAMTQAPGNAYGVELQGRMMMLQGDPNNAIAFFQQALQIDPNLEKTRQWLGELGVAAPAPAAAPQPGMAQPGMAQPGMAQPGMAQPGMPQPGMPGMPGMPQPGMPGMPQAGMPGMPQPGMPGMPQAGMPGMPQPGMPGMPQPGMPGMPQPGMPGMPQPGMQAPGGYPAPGAAAPGAAPAQPPEADHHLEHVSDFFSPDALGFGEVDGSDIETAGPGRLTIVGFVPKSTGSIKTTLIASVFLLLTAGGIIGWVWKNAQETKQIAARYGEILDLLNRDTYADYKRVLEEGNEILKIDDSHALGLSALAYAQLVLGIDHREEGALEKGKSLLAQAEEEAGDERNEWLVSAKAFLAHHEGRVKEGIAEIQEVARATSKVMVQLETFRLRYADDPKSQETKKQMAILREILSNEARAFNHLGRHYYLKEDWGGADRYFTSTLQNVQDNPVGLIGQAAADFERRLGLDERQIEIGKALKKAAELKNEMSKVDLAWFHFVDSQLLNWQGKDEESAKAFEQAMKLDPENSYFRYLRGYGLHFVGHYKDAIAELKKAIKENSEDPRYFVRLIDAQLEANDVSGAKATLAKVENAFAKDAGVRLARGHVLRAEKKYGPAREAYGKLTKADKPQFAKAQVGISKAYRADKDPKKAAKHIVDFMGKAPAWVDPPLQAELMCEAGLAYDQAKEREKAYEAYGFGISQYRYYPPCNLFMCRHLAKINQPAADPCKVYLRLRPRGPLAEEAKRRSGGK